MNKALVSTEGLIFWLSCGLYYCLDSCIRELTVVIFTVFLDGAMLLRTQSDNPAESNWIDIAGKTLFTFRLKTCAFGKIQLRSSHENVTSTPAIEIVIGGMEKRQGRRGRPDLTTTGYDSIEIIYLDYSNVTVSKIFQVTDLLSCNGFRRFWLSWMHQKIELGRNDPYLNILATVNDPVYNRGLKTLQLGTGDLLHQQEWEFVMKTGKIDGSAIRIITVVVKSLIRQTHYDQSAILSLIIFIVVFIVIPFRVPSFGQLFWSI